MSTDWLVSHEATLRSTAFFALLSALALAQRIAPCRGDGQPAWRQVVNLALIAVDTALVRAVFPVVSVVFARQMEEAGIGLLAMVAWPAALEVVIAMVALDLVIYFQHRLFHQSSWLWRAHRVHHSDLAFEVTLGVRFHPVEIAISQVVKCAAIAALGAPPLGVLLFEVVLLSGSLFTHTDIALPARVDRGLRRLIVTPSMHRVHHSVERDETDSNFGFNLVWWDRLFGTYRAAPRRPETTMPIGLDEFRDPAAQGLVALLIQPFRVASTATHAAPEIPHA